MSEKLYWPACWHAANHRDRQEPRMPAKPYSLLVMANAIPTGHPMYRQLFGLLVEFKAIPYPTKPDCTPRVHWFWLNENHLVGLLPYEYRILGHRDTYRAAGIEVPRQQDELGGSTGCTQQ